MFGVVVIPLTFLGCVYYSWVALTPIKVGGFSWLKILVLVNPLIYMNEGFRAALTNAPHMSLWARLRRAARLRGAVPLHRDQGLQEARPELAGEPRRRDEARPRRAETRAFFGRRVPPGWDERFADDGPAFARAPSPTLDPPPGGTVLDLGCGTGRAGSALAAAVGPTGRRGRPRRHPRDARRRPGRRPPRRAGPRRRRRAAPSPPAPSTAVLAAGLLTHLVDPAAALGDLARVVTPRRPAGRVPPGGAGRAGRPPRPPPHPGDLLDPRVLPRRPRRGGLGPRVPRRRRRPLLRARASAG